MENYVYNRLSGIYDSDAIRFWRTTDNKEIDFVINTSFQEGLAYEVKMNCKTVKPASLNKFSNTYPDYPVDVISYDIDTKCKWVLKL